MKNINCPTSIFDNEAIDKIIQLTEGIPRLINKFGSLCLLNAMSEHKKFIDLSVVQNIEKELSFY